MRERRKAISLELRNQILCEYLIGSQGASYLASRYNISPNTIKTWLRCYVYAGEKYVLLLRRKDLNGEDTVKKDLRQSE